MRKGYDGLFALTRDAIGQDPLSGHLFLFVARNVNPRRGAYLAASARSGISAM